MQLHSSYEPAASDFMCYIFLAVCRIMVEEINKSLAADGQQMNEKQRKKKKRQNRRKSKTEKKKEQ